LTSAFLLAGSSAVVATLWDVDDASTRAFMEQFYHRLERGESPDAALAGAKRTMIADSNWDDASVWSAYVLVGNPVPLRDSRARWLVPGVLLAAVVAALAGWRRYRRSSNSTR
jgi:hypothetical protein